MIVGILVSIIVGAICGYIGSSIMNLGGGLIRNIILGILGGVVGSFVFGLIGLSTTNFIGQIISGVVDMKKMKCSTMMMK